MNRDAIYPELGPVQSHFRCSILYNNAVALSRVGQDLLHLGLTGGSSSFGLKSGSQDATQDS